jgi:hypothetical protein
VKLIRLMTTVAGIGLLTTSCYTLQPASAVVPATSTRFAFAINDNGRAALGGSMGPEIRQVEGHLQAKDGEDYMVNVTGVELLQGGYQTWAGETVRIKSSFVSAIYVKKFSPAKTAVAVGGAALAVSMLVSKDFRSFIDPRNTDEDTAVATRRARRPGSFSPFAQPGLPPFLRSLNPPRSH